MKILEYREKKPHGSPDFPVALYSLTEHHPQYIMPCHWHEECELIYVEEGAFAYDIEGRRETAGAGDILFINSGVLHGGIPSKCVYRCIVFGWDLLMKAGPMARALILPLAEGKQRVQLCLPGDEALRGMVLGLARCLEGQLPGYMLTAQGLLLQIMGMAVARGWVLSSGLGKYESPKNIRQLKNALKLIEDQYASPLSLAQLSRAAGMNSKYFCHFFRSMTQRTPIDYLNHHRIEVARQRLTEGCPNITELGYECGFNDLSYFIRVFKRYVGTTPKQYAASLE